MGPSLLFLSVLRFSPFREVRLSLNFPICPLWRAILFGEGLELERVKGVLATSYILHGVLSSAALTEEKQKSYIIYSGKYISFLMKSGAETELTCAYSPKPGRTPVGPEHAPAAGSDTAPRSETWQCGLWRSYNW